MTPNVSPSPAALPLAGLRVLELGHIVAGPAAGQIMADLGADVIKIETVDGGDQVRQMPGAMASMFSMLNRNKRSLAIDLRSADGADVFRRLVSSADVVIDNFSYGAMDRLGLGYEALSAESAGLVWLTIKGFLPGPQEAQPMLDELAQMAGGLAFMTGTADRPTRAGASVIDLGAASYGVVAVLAALRQRDANGGHGQLITAGLFETSVYLVGQWMANAQHDGAPSVPLATMQQGTRMGFSVYQLFDTADGSKVFLGITSNAHWQRFCDALDLAELASEPRFATIDGRVEHRAELVELLNAMMRAHSSETLAMRLRHAGVPFAPVRRPDQLAEDPHLNESDQLLLTPLANGNTGRLPKLPVHSSAFDMSLRVPPPPLGADSRAVLGELGLTPEQIAGLHESGVIGLPGDSRSTRSKRI